MALYDGLGMTGGALPKRANGLLGLLGVQSNPFLDFLGQHSNALVGLGAGIAGGGPDLGQAVGQGLQLGGQGKTADFNRSEKAKADAKLAAQQNYTIDAFKKAGRQDLVDMANSGMMDQAWSKFMKDPIAVGKDTTLLDPNTMKPIFTNTSGDAGSGGPFDGTGMDAQIGNILLRGDPSTQDYAYAYSVASQPKITYTQGPNGLIPVTQTPDLSSVRPPTYKGSVPAPAGAPTATPSAPPAQAMPTGGDTAPIGAFGSGQAGGIQAGTPIPGTQPKPTEQQSRNAAISKIILNDIPNVNQNFQALADPKGQFLSKLGPLGNAWQSTEYQQAASGVAATVANVLYSLSGASSNPGEVVKQIEVLTPKFGDKPGTIAAKLQRFNAYVNAIASQSGDPALIAAVQQATAGLGGAPSPASPPVDMGGGVTIQEIP